MAFHIDRLAGYFQSLSVSQPLQSYPHHCEQLLESEDSTASATFRPDVPDPELSGAQSTMLWELSTLSVRPVSLSLQ